MVGRPEFFFIDVRSLTKVSGNYSFPIFALAIELITSATACAFVGPELCRNPEWLTTATGYTIE